MGKEAQSKPAPKKKEKDQTGFAIAVVVLSLICIPYLAYGIWINYYAFSSGTKPEGYYFPNYADLWKMVVGAVVIMGIRKLFFVCLYSQALLISKEQDDDHLRHKYATKAVNTLFNSCYFAVSAAWGWAVLKDKKTLPWYIGGHGSLDNFTYNSIYLEFD